MESAGAGLNPFAVFIATTIGRLAGKAHDPLFLFLLAVALILGVLGIRYWWIIGLCAAGTAITTVLAYSWWVDLGIANQWIRLSVWNFYLTLLGASIVFLCGKLVRTIVSGVRRGRAPSAPP